jgi:hypothetical protein
MKFKQYALCVRADNLQVKSEMALPFFIDLFWQSSIPTTSFFIDKYDLSIIQEFLP